MDTKRTVDTVPITEGPASGTEASAPRGEAEAPPAPAPGDAAALWTEADLRWMDAALAHARAAEAAGDVPVGCVLVDASGALVAAGHNTREAARDPTGHAEMIALREAARVLGRWRLTDLTAYVTLEPCFMCAGALVHARVGRVVYATRDPKTGAAGSLANVLQDPRLNHRCDVAVGAREAEASAMLKAFFRARRR